LLSSHCAFHLDCSTLATVDIPEVRQRISPLGVEEYHRLDEYNENGRRTELIRGLVIEKMAKSPLHRAVTSLLSRSFKSKKAREFRSRASEEIS
jgi:hypothetical protein